MRAMISLSAFIAAVTAGFGTLRSLGARAPAGVVRKQTVSHEHGRSRIACALSGPLQSQVMGCTDSRLLATGVVTT